MKELLDNGAVRTTIPAEHFQVADQTISNLGLKSDLDNRIKEITLVTIREAGSRDKTGCQISLISTVIEEFLSEAEVQQVVTELLDNGEIHTTISAEHFRVAEGDVAFQSGAGNLTPARTHSGNRSRTC